MSENTPVSINLQVGGVADVRKAFQSVIDVMEKAERQATAKTSEEAKKRVQIAKVEATDKKKAIASVGQEVAKAATAFTNANKTMAKVGSQYALAWHRGWKTSMDNMRQDAERASTAIKRAFSDMAPRNAFDGLKAGMRELSAMAMKTAGIMRSSFTLGNGTFATSASRAMGPKGTAFGAASSAIGYAKTAAMIGGGYMIADAARQSMATESAAIALSNSMMNPNDAEQAAYLGGKRFDHKKAMAFASRIQAEAGIDKTSVLTGLQDYVAKSSDWKAIDTKEGQGAMVELARLASSSGSDFGEVMGAAGSLRVQNPNLAPEKMLQLMYGIVGQGKMGAVEMKDLAQHSSVITAGANSYKLGEGGYKDQATAQGALLGMSQIAIRAAGTPAEAATAVARFTTDIAQHAKKAQSKDSSLHLVDKNGKLAQNSSLLEQIFAKTGGDQTKMKDVFGLGERGIRVALGAAGTYSNAQQMAMAEMNADPVTSKLSQEEKEKRARAIGAKAVGDEARRFENATYSKEHSDGDLSAKMAGNGMKLQMSFQKLSDLVEQHVTPHVAKFVDSLVKSGPGIEKFINAVAKVAQFLIDNPFTGLGAIVGAAVIKDIVAAGIGQAIAKVATTSIAASLGGQLAIATAAVAIGTVSIMAISHLLKEDRDADQAAIEAQMAAERGERSVLGGGSTLEAQKALMKAQSDVALAKQSLEEKNSSWSGKAATGGAVVRDMFNSFRTGEGDVGAALLGQGEGVKSIMEERTKREENIVRATAATERLTKALEAARVRDAIFGIGMGVLSNKSDPIVKRAAE